MQTACSHSMRACLAYIPYPTGVKLDGLSLDLSYPCHEALPTAANPPRSKNNPSPSRIHWCVLMFQPPPSRQSTSATIIDFPCCMPCVELNSPRRPSHDRSAWSSGLFPPCTAFMHFAAFLSSSIACTAPPYLTRCARQRIARLAAERSRCHPAVGHLP